MNPAVLPPALMAAVSIYSGIFYLWSYLRMGRGKMSLFFAFTSISIGIYDILCSGLYSSLSISEGMIWQKYQFLLLGFFEISFIWFIYYYTESNRFKGYLSLSLLLGAVTLTGFFVSGDFTLSQTSSFVRTVSLPFGWEVTYYEARPGIIYISEYILLLIAALFLLLQVFYYYLSERKKETLFLLVSLLLFLAASLNDIIIGLNIYKAVYLAEYSYMVIILSMAFAMQNRLIALHREVEELNLLLEGKINDQTTRLIANEIGSDIFQDVTDNKETEEKNVFSPLEKLSKDLSLIANLDNILSYTLEKAVHLTGSSGGMLIIKNEHGEPQLRSSRFPSDIQAPEVTMEKIIEMTPGKPVLLSEKKQKSSGNLYHEIYGITLPIMFNNESIGLCYFQAFENFKENDIHKTSEFIKHATLVLENAFLYQRMVNRVKKNEKISLSHDIEDKIRGAISYIEENYQYEISRENLAEALNMHPDSLSRYFKVFTGEKMHDYINRLRIGEAARRLVSGNDTIITIAFAVGFESITTFNRVFGKMMKESPSKYREKYQ